MRRKGNVRLIDIAREVGCTVNTVSRALRNKDDISEKTKKKVREVANRLGYIPNSIASSLRSGLSYTVAIIFENLINPYYMIMTDKLHRRLEELGYATLIFAVHDYTLNPKRSVRLSPEKLTASSPFGTDRRNDCFVRQKQHCISAFGKKEYQIEN